jgi:hypothetical protein
MCGRFALYALRRADSRSSSLLDDGFDSFDFGPRYNLAPTAQVLVIHSESSDRRPDSPTSPLRQLHRRQVGAPVKGQYFDVVTPITGKVYTQAARSTAEDIELALDAAHAAAAWGKTSAAERANVLLKIADRIEQPTSNCWPTPRPWTTASRSAKR